MLGKRKLPSVYHADHRIFSKPWKKFHTIFQGLEKATSRAALNRLWRWRRRGRLPLGRFAVQ